MNERRNYRMFKKRVAEMDIYQEYRRSHDRVKVMLKEEVDMVISEESKTPVSAQENLRNFIKQHENRQAIPEPVPNSPTEEELDQAFIDLKQDTILNPVSHETQKLSDQTTYQDKNNYDYKNFDYEYSTTKNIPSEENSEFYEQFNQSNNDIEKQSKSYINQQEQRTQFKSVKVEDELESIIRDALTNFNPGHNIESSDIDPELLKLVKEFIYSTNMADSFNESYFNASPLEQPYFNQSGQDYSFTQPEGFQNPLQDSINPATVSQNEPDQEAKGNEAAILEKQIQDQQVPPKVPNIKATVKRPGIPQSMGSLETTFPATDYDDDSSLALTKNELKMQVKNLIKESLAENELESTAKPNDLLQLEKQLKEHIEKLKQSRKA